MRYPTIAVGMLLLSASSICNAQFPWQKPVPRSQEAVARILGPVTQEEPSRDLTIVWVWGVDKLHEKGTHEYAWVMDDYVNTLLPQVPRVTAIPSMYFPKKELWDKADLVVFYLWPREPDAGLRRGVGQMHRQGLGPQEWSHEMGRAAHAGDSYRCGTAISHLQGLPQEVRSDGRILLGASRRSGRLPHPRWKTWTARPGRSCGQRKSAVARSSSPARATITSHSTTRIFVSFCCGPWHGR